MVETKATSNLEPEERDIVLTKMGMKHYLPRPNHPTLKQAHTGDYRSNHGNVPVGITTKIKSFALCTAINSHIGSHRSNFAFCTAVNSCNQGDTVGVIVHEFEGFTAGDEKRKFVCHGRNIKRKSYFQPTWQVHTSDLEPDPAINHGINIIIT